MLYRNTRSMVRSPDGDTFFEITTGVLQGDTLATFLFILFLDYILKTAIDKSTELGFTLTQRRSRRYPSLHITDIDYADIDIAVNTNTMNDENTLLHQIEETADDIGLDINSDNTEYMRLNPNSDDGNMKSKNGNIIKQVENLKYLKYLSSLDVESYYNLIK